LVIASAEQALGRSLPYDLRSLLAESDGIEDEYGTDIVWSAERIAAENRVSRLRSPATGLLLFGETENGGAFGCVLPAEGEAPPDVYLQHTADGSRRWVASDLRTLLEEWFTRAIER
jgi:cell wall assembly regulator SMI1